MLGQILLNADRVREYPLQLQALIVQLRRYVDRQGWCWPSQASLAADLGCTRQTANKWVRIACELGVIAEKVDHGPRQVCEYRLAPEFMAASGPKFTRSRGRQARLPLSKNQTPRQSKKPRSEFKPKLSEPVAARSRARGPQETQGEINAAVASQPASGLFQTAEAEVEAATPTVAATPAAPQATPPRLHRRPPTPAEAERRAAERAERRAIARAKRANLVVTAERWARLAPEAGSAEDRLALVETLNRSRAGLHDWGGRAESDKRAFDALIARVRRHPLPAEIVRAAWQQDQGPFGRAAEVLRQNGWFHGGKRADLEHRARPAIATPRLPARLAPPDDLAAAMAARLARAGLGGSR